MKYLSQAKNLLWPGNSRSNSLPQPPKNTSTSADIERWKGVYSLTYEMVILMMQIKETKDEQTARLDILLPHKEVLAELFGRNRSARQRFEKMLVEDPNNEDAEFELERLEMGVDDLKRAVRAVNEAIEYGVVVFRGTGLTDESHLEFSRQFGGLDNVKPYIRAGRPNRLEYDELFDVSNVEIDGKILDPESPRGQTNRGNDLFHVDSSFNPRRAGCSLLLAHELPPSGLGGHTAFADTRTAYDDLPSETKERLKTNNYIANHCTHHSRKLAAPEYFANLDPLDYPMGRHYLLQQHEAPGRMNLYIASHVHHLECPESTEKTQELFKEMYAHATQDKYVVEIEWSHPGDLVVWDNTCTMHRAVGGPFLRKYKRDMRRATVHDSSSQAWELNEHTPGFISLNLTKRLGPN